MTKQEEAKAALDALTPRQAEVALMAAQGLSHKEIANALCRGEGTIKTHLNQVYERLKIKKNTQFAVMATLAGWLVDWRHE